MVINSDFQPIHKAENAVALLELIYQRLTDIFVEKENRLQRERKMLDWSDPVGWTLDQGQYRDDVTACLCVCVRACTCVFSDNLPFPFKIVRCIFRET